MPVPNQKKIFTMIGGKLVENDFLSCVFPTSLACSELAASTFIPTPNCSEIFPRKSKVLSENIST